MAESKRNAVLTVFAIVLALLAIEDFLKPFRLEGPDTGIVFLGMRLQGSLAYVGWLIAAFLAVFAVGVWQMRGYARLMAYGYLAYVVLNILIFTATHPMPPTRSEQIFGIVYSVLAIAGASALAVVLHRRREQLT